MGVKPDDDTSTTLDIPDVINNSWRWYDDDTIHCEGFIVNLMNAIEAVGIANVFSEVIQDLITQLLIHLKELILLK